MTFKQILTAFAVAAVVATQALASGGSGGGGGGGGGGGVGTPAVNPLPSTAPAADVLLRESFGPGLDPAFSRPQGGSGNLRQTFAGTGLTGFWLEYPGSKGTTW